MPGLGVIPPTTIQSLLLDRDRFATAQAAQRWARRQGFRNVRPEATPNYYRIRQRPPGQFRPRSFRTIAIAPGVKAIIGHLSGIVLHHAPVIYETHPNGLAHVRSSLAHIAELAAAGAKTYPIRHLATEITRAVPSKQTRAELAAIYKWTRDNIRYRKDPVSCEWIQSPERTLTEGAGDCDDITAVISALAQSLGHPVQYKTVGPSANVQKHVFAVVWDGSQWVTLDPVLEPPRDSTEPRADLGRFGQVAPGAGHRWSDQGTMLHGKDDPIAARLWDTTPGYFKDGLPVVPERAYQSLRTHGEQSEMGDTIDTAAAVASGAAALIPGVGPVVSTLIPGAVSLAKKLFSGPSKGTPVPDPSAAAAAAAAPSAAGAPAAGRGGAITVSPDISIRLAGLAAGPAADSWIQSEQPAGPKPVWYNDYIKAQTDELVRHNWPGGRKGAEKYTRQFADKFVASGTLPPGIKAPASFVAKQGAQTAGGSADFPISLLPHISIEVPRDLDRAKAAADRINQLVEQSAIYRATAAGSAKEITALRTAGKRATKRLVLTTRSAGRSATSLKKAIALNKIYKGRIAAAARQAAAAKASAWKKPHTAAALRYPFDARQVYDRATGRFHIFLPDAGQLGAFKPQFSITLGATDPRSDRLPSIQAAARDAWITVKNYMKAHPKESGPPNAIYEVRQFQTKEGTLTPFDGLYGPNSRTAIAYYVNQPVDSMPPVATKWRSLPVTWRPPTAAKPAAAAKVAPPVKHPAAKPAALPSDTRSSRLPAIQAAAKAALFSITKPEPSIAIPQIRQFQAQDGTLKSDGLYGPNTRQAMAWYLGRSDVSNMPSIYPAWRKAPVTWRPPAAPAKVITFTEPERVIVKRPATAAAKLAPPVKQAAAAAAQPARRVVIVKRPTAAAAKLAPPVKQAAAAAAKLAPPVKQAAAAAAQPARRVVIVKRPAAAAAAKPAAQVKRTIKIVRQTVRQVVREGLPIATAAGLIPSMPVRVRPGAVVGQITRDSAGRIRVSGYVEVGQEAANPGITPVGYDMPRAQAAGKGGLFPLLALAAAAGWFA